MWPGWSSMQHGVVSSSRKQQLYNTEHNSAAVWWLFLIGVLWIQWLMAHDTYEGVSAIFHVGSGICCFFLGPVLVPVNNIFLFHPNFLPVLEDFIFSTVYDTQHLNLSSCLDVFYYKKNKNSSKKLQLLQVLSTSSLEEVFFSFKPIAAFTWLHCNSGKSTGPTANTLCGLHSLRASDCFQKGEKKKEY